MTSQKIDEPVRSVQTVPNVVHGPQRISGPMMGPEVSDEGFPRYVANHQALSVEERALHIPVHIQAAGLGLPGLLLVVLDEHAHQRQSIDVIVEPEGEPFVEKNERHLKNKPSRKRYF